MTSARAGAGAGAVSESTGHPIRKFNPGTHQSDEALIAQFAVRKHELDIVLEILGGNIGSPSCQHMLLIGPRGMGKTMLLARVAAELRTVNALSQHLLPVRFAEESHEISSLADFWLETLFHLAREVALGHPELATELRATRADLAGRWREREMEEQARVAVLSAADRLDRRLVLMVENLQSLPLFCKRKGEGKRGGGDLGWILRQTLQSEPQIILLASATSRFETLDDVKQPFFEMFRIISLEPLAAKDCQCLWQIAGDNAVSERKIRPLQILTGGNPRLLVIVSGFARHRSLRQLMEDLVTLIDNHTEYFRGHLEAFPETERRVYIALVDLWQPSASGEVAARARMSVRIVSTMLKRLCGRGVVIMEKSGKKRLYAASERLYSIYYKLRRERDEAAIVVSLIRFMVAFYNESELSGMSKQLALEAADSQSVREGWARVLAEQQRDGSAFFGKAWLPMRQMLDQVSTDDRSMSRQLLGQETDTVPDDGAAMEAAEIVDEDIATQGKDPPPQSASRIAGQLCMKAVAHGQRKDFQAVVATCNEVLERFGDSDAPEVQWWAAWASVLKGRALSESRRFQGRGRRLRRGGRALRRQRRAGSPVAGRLGVGNQGELADESRRFQGRGRRLRRGGRALRRQRRVGGPAAGRLGVGAQGARAGESRRFQGRGRRLRRGGRALRRQRRAGGPAAGRLGVGAQGARADESRRFQGRGRRLRRGGRALRRQRRAGGPAAGRLGVGGQRGRAGESRRFQGRGRRLRRGGRALRRQRRAGGPAAGRLGVGGPRGRAGESRRFQGRGRRLRRGGRALRRQRRAGGPVAGRLGVGNQGERADESRRFQGRGRRLRRGGRALRRQRRAGGPAVGRLGVGGQRGRAGESRRFQGRGRRLRRGGRALRRQRRAGGPVAGRLGVGNSRGAR